MKKSNLPAAIRTFLFALIFLPGFLNAQKNKESVVQPTAANLVDSQHYRFVAESAIPVSGRQRQLDAQYDLTVSKETVISDLPYFGAAYFSPVNPAEGGIKFTSKNFDYSMEKKKKDGWEIFIKGRDMVDPPVMHLTVYSNSKATLGVSSNTRQAISFNGYIEAVGKEK